ncbi:hypothetical protein BX600DRAFT_20440 [Xylariales sp. PMI_506]|nr:hypothetical protein BX600DRAFT_20440 [Xylariales sp. PMI_506]
MPAELYKCNRAVPPLPQPSACQPFEKLFLLWNHSYLPMLMLEMTARHKFWKSKLAAYSTFPPVASSACMASCRSTPKFIKVSMSDSGKDRVVVVGGALLGAEVDEGPTTAPERAPIVVPPGPCTVGSRFTASSVSLGTSASPRKSTSSP